VVKIDIYEGTPNYFIIKIFSHHKFVFDILNFCNKHKCKFVRKGYNRDTDLKELLGIEYSAVESE